VLPQKPSGAHNRACLGFRRPFYQAAMTPSPGGSARIATGEIDQSSPDSHAPADATASGGKIQPGREILDFTNQAAEDVHV
jgi:hypothetical protein